jgi:hypothetical protein
MEIEEDVLRSVSACPAKETKCAKGDFEDDAMTFVHEDARPHDDDEPTERSRLAAACVALTAGLAGAIVTLLSTR